MSYSYQVLCLEVVCKCCDQELVHELAQVTIKNLKNTFKDYTMLEIQNNKYPIDLCLA